MRKLLVIAALLVATTSWALERPEFGATKFDWIRYAAAVEDSMFAWREAYYDARIDLADCEHALWVAQWDATSPDKCTSSRWWMVGAALVAGAVAGYVASR